MPVYLMRHRVLISIALVSIILTALLFWNASSPVVSIFSLLAIFSISITFTTRNHWQTYVKAECTREKMVRNLVLDLIGLLVTMGAAMYVGRLAGGYFGIRAGFWIGLLAGFLGGFLAAWMVRSVWGKLVGAVA